MLRIVSFVFIAFALANFLWDSNAVNPLVSSVEIPRSQVLSSQQASEPSEIHNMDSYLLKADLGQHYLFITQLEIPIHASNKPLEVLAYEVTPSMELMKSHFDLQAKGVHMRNIFDLKTPTNHYVYMCDHGLDTYPFPGGNVFRFDLKTGELKTYSEFANKFNFSGAAYYYQGKTFEAFVGMQYEPQLFVDQIKDESFASAIKGVVDPQGYLTATFFETQEGLNLFLGLSDNNEKDIKGRERFDLVLRYKNGQWSHTKIPRKVESTWATVYSSMDEIRGKQVLKVAYHNLGFNEAEIGYLDMTSNFSYQRIAGSSELGLRNQWIPSYLIAEAEGSPSFLISVKGGSGGGAGKYLEWSRGKIVAEKGYFLGLHPIGRSFFGVNYERKLELLKELR